MKQYFFYILACIAMISVSCEPKVETNVDGQQTPIVSVGNSVLYKSDLERALPSRLSQEDSIKVTEAYIKSWVEDKLIYQKAKENIVDQESIDKLVEDYRNSLIVHNYQDHLLKEYLSENLPDKELLDFYEKNKDMFKLKENIIKGLFLKIPLESAELKNFKKWYTQTNHEAIENIEKKQLQNAVAYDFFYDRWVSLETVMENIPYLVDDEQKFLKANKYLEVQDSSFVYLLNIKEYKLVGESAPYEFEKSTLTEYYLKKKETDLLNQIREDLYNKALSDDKVVFYNK